MIPLIDCGERLVDEHRVASTFDVSARRAITRTYFANPHVVRCGENGTDARSGGQPIRAWNPAHTGRLVIVSAGARDTTRSLVGPGFLALEKLFEIEIPSVQIV